MTDPDALARLTTEIVACRRCHRLVDWRERVAREKVDHPCDRLCHGMRRPATPTLRPRRGGGCRWFRIVGSYHPSQQNTYTGRLSVPMFDAVIRRAAALAASPLVM